jgi:D-3-phosphoglycerate dehydrogenase / 2-oxoglutarate reductase
MNILVLNNVATKGLENHNVGPNIVSPEGILVRSDKVDTSDFVRLVAVARAGAGVNNITVKKATEQGVCVFNTPGANANAVAELVFAVLGVYARNIDRALEFVKTLEGDDEQITAKVEGAKAQFTGFELAHKALGIIGLGKIGVLVANAGIQKGMRVVGYDAFPTLSNMHQLDGRVEVARSMEEVLTAADVLSVHVPLCDKTRNMIGTPQIDLMKDGCILINFSRGGIYNEQVVIEALNSRKVAGYLTDFPTNDLLAHDRVICTPHLGASTNESEGNCATMACEQLKNYLEYGVTTNSVNFPSLEVGKPQAVKTRLAIVNKDVPNVIASITGVLGSAGLNIQNLVNSSNGVLGYNLVDFEAHVPQQLVVRISDIPDVLRVRVLSFS